MKKTAPTQDSFGLQERGFYYHSAPKSLKKCVCVFLLLLNYTGDAYKLKV